MINILINISLPTLLSVAVKWEIFSFLSNEQSLQSLFYLLANETNFTSQNDALPVQIFPQKKLPFMSTRDYILPEVLPLYVV